MRANQHLVAQDGYEVMLFPMDVLNMTQDEGSDFSHAGTYNIDFVGNYPSYPMYAPCSLRIRQVLTDGSNGLILDSTNKVHLPNGNLDYITLLVAHCNYPPSTTIGHVFNQGELFYRTGTAGYVTGDHVHMCIGQGSGGYMVQRPSGNWDLSNRIHMWEGMYVNDTDIINGYGHNWIRYTGPTPTPTRKKSRFPWVLYARRFRNGGR